MCVPSESDRRNITRDRHTDALAAFAARTRARATHTTAPRPLRSARHSPSCHPDLACQHFRESQHSTSALHSTHQLAPHATPAALYAKSHTRRAILAAARLLYAQQQTL